MIDLLFITLIIVFIVDISGIIPNIKGMISLYLTKGKIRKTDYSLKPFDCSLCLTFWVGLIYVLVFNLSIGYMFYVCMLAFFTEVFKNILYLLKDIVNELINKIYSIWTKN